MLKKIKFNLATSQKSIFVSDETFSPEKLAKVSPKILFFCFWCIYCRLSSSAGGSYHINSTII